MKRQCPPKFTSLGYSKRSMNGGPLAQIPERNEGKETCSETIVTIHLFMMKKTTCFRWEYLAPCGRIFCVSPSVGTNLTGRLQTMGTAMEIYQTPCGKWSNLPKLSTAMANLWELFFLKFCFTKPNEANTSCIHVLVSWLVLKQFSIFLLSYRSTSLET